VKVGESTEKIDKQIEELQKLKMELLVKEGKAFRCRKCGTITMRKPFKSSFDLEREKEELCYDCWSKEVKKRRREKLLKMLSKARIVDVEPVNNPFYDISDVTKIVLEVDGKRYEVRPAGWDELYIKINEVEPE